MIQKNYELYLARREPAVLTRLKTKEILPSYPALREINDVKVIAGLIDELNSLGGEYVLLPWISPPYGEVVGYGWYKKEEADILLKRNERQRWAFPQLGRSYDKNKLENKLKNLSNKDLQI